MYESKNETISWIEGTALGITLRNINFIMPHAHEKMIEITMCLEGCVTFSYCFEEFQLRAGEFILVDRDTHYLYSENGALCASFYIDLEQDRGIYREFIDQMFVCEGTADSEVPYNTADHKKLRGILLAILEYLLKYDRAEQRFIEDIWKATDKLMELIYYRFDICQWSSRDNDMTEKTLLRLKKIVEYMLQHCNETVTLKQVAELTGVTEGYMSSMLSKYAIGFNNILTYIRSWKAERMLLTTDMSIAEISAECHFSSPKYMYAAFEFWYNCKPNEFRRKYRNEMKKDNVETLVEIRAAQSQIDGLVKKQLISMYMEREELYD